MRCMLPYSHNWRVEKTAGNFKYQECTKCSKRSIKVVATLPFPFGGIIQEQWLKGEPLITREERMKNARASDTLRAAKDVTGDDEKINDLISHSLWSARRLPKVYKRSALNDLLSIIGDDHKHSDYVKGLLLELDKVGNAHV